MFFIFPDSAFSECSDFTLNSDSNEGLNKQVPDVEYGFLIDRMQFIDGLCLIYITNSVVVVICNLYFCYLNY